MSASISAETFAAYFHPDAVLARCSAAEPRKALSAQPATFSAEDAAASTTEERQSWKRREEHGALLPAAHLPRGSGGNAAARHSRCGSGAVATLRVPGRTFPVRIFYAEDLEKLVDLSSIVKPRSSSASSGGPRINAAGHSGADREGRRTALEPQREENPAGAAADDRWVAAAELSSGLTPTSLMCGSREMPYAVAELVKYIHLKKPQHLSATRQHRAFYEESTAGTEGAGTGATATEDSEREQSCSDIRTNKQASGGGSERNSQGAAEKGAILVFTSGVGEVAAMCRAIEELHLPLWVLPCHASLHLKQQQQVFSRAPPGMRKVVVATNIAETSITIPDISYVIDTGLHKQMHYEVCKRLNQLQEEVISRSSAQQRAGRAGRVGPGECYRLYSKNVFDKLMHQTEKPELQRQPLENVCLQLKAIYPEEKVSLLLSQCIEPPSVDSVSTAIRRLCRVGALRVDALGKEHLTAFGSVLSLFPMDLLVARMLLYSATLSCLDEVLALCALMAVESVLYQSHNANPGATEARLKYFSRSQSDFITNLRVFLAWRRQSAEGNRRAEDTFCSTFGVNSQTMRNAEELRKRFSRVVDEVSLRLLQEEDQKGTVGDRSTAPPAWRRIQSSSSPKASCGLRGGELIARVDEEEADERIVHSAVLSEGDLAGARSQVNKAQEGSLCGDSEMERTTAVESESSLFCSSDGLKYGNQTDSQRSLHRLKGDSGESEAERRARSKFWHIKACVAAGLYPQVALVQTPKKRFTQVASGAVEKVAEAREIKFMAYLDDGDTCDKGSAQHGPGDTTASKLQRVFIHPSSVIFKSGAFETQWVAYMEKVQTTKPFIKEVSTVSIFALLLLSCCGLRVEGGKGILCLDDWIQLRCPGLIGTFLKNLKALFYLLLELCMRETMNRIREKGCTLSQWNGTLSPVGEGSPGQRTGDSRCLFGERGQEDIFSGKIGNRLRNELVDLVKRLVEFEGHRL